MKTIVPIITLFFHLLVLGQEKAYVDSLSFVIEPYLQRVTDTSFKVLFETSIEAKTLLYVGEAQRNVIVPPMELVAVSETYGKLHNIKATDLQVETQYFYQAKAVSKTGDTIAGKVTPIIIPDYSKRAVSFSVLGDTQNRPEVWGVLADLIYGQRPNFILHVGDLVQHGPNKVDWTEEFFKPEPVKKLLRHYPIYPILGNHERNVHYYYDYFDLPEPEWFHAIRRGNVLFVGVDANKDLMPGSVQYQKLESVLAQSTAEWKIVYQHQHVYNSEETWVQKPTYADPNLPHMRRLYADYGVDVVFNGHVHNYERTRPIYYDTLDEFRGVVYITTGGGGGRLDESASAKSWFSAKTQKVHHYLNVSIWKKTLVLEAIDIDGKIIDRWNLEKKENKVNPPLITSGAFYFTDKTKVTIANPNPLQQGSIYYKVGSSPYKEWKGKQIELSIGASTDISTYFLREDGARSNRITKSFYRVGLFKKCNVGPEKVKAEYFEGNYTHLPDFDKEKVIRSFVSDSISLDIIHPRREDHWAVRFKGTIKVPDTGIYRLTDRSYDGSKVIIDGKSIIDNDGMHYERRKEVFLALEEGIHTFEVQFFDFTRRETLELAMGLKNTEMKPFNDYVVTD